MKNLTIALDGRILAKARIEAAREGKSMSRFVADLIAGRVGTALTQKEAMDRFLAGPLLDLTDAEGRAPTRDALYER